MGFTAVVPARLGARRLPDKPLADIGGKPMIAHVLAQAAAAGADRVIAAVDSERIAAAAEQAGFEAVLTGACTCGTERVAQAAAALKLTGVIVNLQGDEPFIGPAAVAAVAERAADAQWCATAATPLPAAAAADSSVVRVVVAKDGRALYFSREPVPHQAAEQLAHVGIYAFSSPEALAELAGLAPCALERTERLEQLRWLWHGYRIDVVQVAASGGGIDTQQDLEQARALYADMQGNEPQAGD